MRFKDCYTAIFLFLLMGCAGRSGFRNKEWAEELDQPGLRNFYRVSDSVYRCAQPGANGFREASKMGIKSVLNLRAGHSDTGKIKNAALHYYEVKMVTSSFSNQEIIAALRIIKQAPKPILVHCKHGADRTGTVIAMYRVIVQQWPRTKALDELENGGYSFHRQYKNIPQYVLHADSAYIRNQVMLP